MKEQIKKKHFVFTTVFWGRENETLFFPNNVKEQIKKNFLFSRPFCLDFISRKNLGEKYTLLFALSHLVHRTCIFELEHNA